MTQQYIEIHKQKKGLQNLPKSQLRSVYIVVNKKLNATAIEPWLRTKNTRHALSIKLSIITYLAESKYESNEFSRSDLTSRLSMLVNIVRGFTSCVFGYYLKLRYDVV